MNKSRINFHIERKRISCILVMFVMVTLVLNIVITVATSYNQAQLKALFNSDYLYSVIIKNTVDCDGYYQFDAGIGFSLKESMNKVLNVEVFMQLQEAEYTDKISWNADKLSRNGVAISEMIAKQNDLKLGDLVYSKHIVNGSICEYQIEQIIPKVMCVRNVGKTYSDGVIIMGFDELYTENIRNNVVMFTQDSIEAVSDRYDEIPEGIVYREDEITTVMKELIPYFIVKWLISVVAVICLTKVLVKEVSYNFKRLMILGYEVRNLNKAYSRYILGIGLSAIMLSIIISMLVLFCMNILEDAVILMVGATLIECVMLLIIKEIAKRRLWRN